MELLNKFSYAPDGRPLQNNQLTAVRKCRTKTAIVKTETIYARVTEAMAQQVHQRATDLGESDAFVLREALREYFEARQPKQLALGGLTLAEAESRAVAAAKREIASYRADERHRKQAGKKPKA